MNFVSAFALFLACSGTAAPALPTAVAPAVGTPAGGGALSAAALYGACQARVEGSSTPDECHTDSDCARAGCSQEVCVSARRVSEVQSTCERLPCFTTLDTCGCHEGICSWTLKEPEGLLKSPLPGAPMVPEAAPAGAAPAVPADVQ